MWLSGLFTLIFAVAAFTNAGQANAAYTTLSVTFEESAPKDIFTIRNTGSCKTGALSLSIDLSSSKSGLIFDPTASGAGVEVFQPLEIQRGQNLVTSVSDVRDGDSKVTFALKSLKPEAVVSFTVDVDDTLRQSERGQTMISGSEMQGTSVLITHGSQTVLKSVFSAEATTFVKRVPCV